MSIQMDLRDYLYLKEKETFVWGTLDCATFAGDWVKFQTGTDPVEKFRGKYDTPEGSYIALKRAGFASLEEAVTDAIGTPIDNNNFARRGDVCLLANEGNPCLGIVISNEQVAGVVEIEHGYPQTVIYIPFTEVLKVWSLEECRQSPQL